MAHVYVLNGPNLNRLGSREPEIYGHTTFADLTDACLNAAEDLGVTATVLQTNDESELIGWLHRAQDEGAAVVINPAAFTHYSYALRDACALVTTPLVEVHISNPAAREEFRHTSVVSGVATGTIAGFGIDSYRLALRAVAALMPAS
jgi:3-dehydroquinate dehydratase-2